MILEMLSYRRFSLEDYLMDRLNPTEKDKLEKEIKNNPGLRAELEELELTLLLIESAFFKRKILP